MQQYVAPLWLAGKGFVAGNVQTIWPAVASRVHPDRRNDPVAYQRERWHTPDQDFIDVDRFPAASAREGRPLLVLFTGWKAHPRATTRGRSRCGRMRKAGITPCRISAAALAS